MARLLKCYGESCLEKDARYEREDLKKIKEKNYCIDCYEKKTKEIKDKENLVEYIKKVYDIPFVTPLMWKHINQFLANGLTYKRIYALIHYCKEIKNGYELPPEKYGLIILGNYYTEMMVYYKNRKEQKKKNKGKQNKVKIVSVDARVFRENKYQKSKDIDMEEL